MESNVSEKLLPCPFCGSDDLVIEAALVSTEPRYVLCECGGSNTVAAWNTRARPAPTGADVEGVAEQIARIIDPSSWRVMDGYLAETKRKYRGENVGWPSDQFHHKESMAKAQAILNLIQPKEQTDG